MRSFNDRQLIGYRKTSHALKRKEKINLKLDWENVEKLKFFDLTFTIFSFFKLL